VFLGACAEPDDEGCQGEGPEVDLGTFLVAGGDGPEVLEAVDGTFDGVAFLVAFAFEAAWPAASGTSILPVPLLVETFEDGVTDSALSQVAAVLPGGVGLVRQDMTGPGAGSSDSDAGHEDLLQHALN
jgi:hypothetical protein